MISFLRRERRDLRAAHRDIVAHMLKASMKRHCLNHLLGADTMYVASLLYTGATNVI